jgi:dihydroorotate dehydrogenase (NAD+) catalytic subunit
MRQRRIACPHHPAKGRDQLRPGGTQFFVMMKRQFGENPFSLGSKREKNFAAVILRARALYEAAGLEPVDQFDGAVVADIHAVGQLADSRPHVRRHALNGQHQLILPTFQPGLFHDLFAEMKKSANLVAKLRQCLIIRQGELLHAADCIVPRFNAKTIVYRNTIQGKNAQASGFVLSPSLRASVVRPASTPFRPTLPLCKLPYAMSTGPSAAKSPVDLSVNVSGIALKNPIMAASGTFGYGVEFEDIVDLSKLGAFVVKGLSREPMIGNPPPRLWETAAGMLNAIGLQNIGAEAFLAEKLTRLEAMKNVVVIANVFGYTREDYERTIEILNDGEGIAAYELNVSCPNTSEGGLQFGCDPRALDEVVTTAKRAARRPLIVKLSPNVTSIAQMAHIAQESGADALSLVNTFVAMAIDPETRKPRIANVTAGLSGPAIKPIALRMVYDAAHEVSIPVIGMGGISTAADVVEFMLAGATAVQIGTASYWDPCATEKIVDELGRWCTDRSIKRLAELTGGLIVE